MKQKEFSEHVAEYDARMSMIAKDSGYEVLFMHSIIDPKTGEVFTLGTSNITNLNHVAVCAVRQAQYIGNEILK